MSKGKYRITITETDTGKVVMDTETPAVFTVASVAGGTVNCTGMKRCSNWEALNLLWAVDSARDKILNDNPVLKVGYEPRDSLVNETVVADVTALESLK